MTEISQVYITSQKDHITPYGGLDSGQGGEGVPS